MVSQLSIIREMVYLSIITFYADCCFAFDGQREFPLRKKFDGPISGSLILKETS
jgi:hypothetical protein